MTTDTIELRTCPLAGCPAAGPTVLTTANGYLFPGFAIRQGRLFWAEYDPNTTYLQRLWSCDIATGCSTKRDQGLMPRGKLGFFTVPGGFAITFETAENQGGSDFVATGKVLGCVATDCANGLETLAGPLDEHPPRVVVGDGTHLWISGGQAMHAGSWDNPGVYRVE